MQKQTINIDELRQALMLAKDTPDSEDDQNSYQIFENAQTAISMIDKYKIYELKNDLLNLLQCENDYIRREAIATLCFSTRLYLEEFKDPAYDVWLNDPSNYVKSTALAAWSVFYMDTQNKETIKELYTILINNNFNSDIRATAYNCLFDTVDINHPDYNDIDFGKLLN